MINKVAFRSEVISHGGVQLLRIWDLYDDNFPTMTVTNGAEEVLSGLQGNLGKLPALIIYKDSSGDWDRMLWNGKRVGFKRIAPNAPRLLSDEQAMDIAVNEFMKEHGESAQSERIRLYKTYTLSLKNNGARTTTFKCPSCEQELITLAAGKGEVWDSFSTCPYCEQVFMKVTDGDNVTVRKA